MVNGNRYFNLANNQIGDAKAKKLAKTLEKNTTLTTLNLSGNQIGDDGAKKLAKVLKNNTTLTTLNLYGNDIENSKFNIKENLNIIYYNGNTTINFDKAKTLYNKILRFQELSDDEISELIKRGSAVKFLLDQHYESNPNHPDLASSYNNLGAVYADKGEYDKAIEYYQNALEIFIVAYTDTPHPHLISCYKNLIASCQNNNNPYLVVQ